MFLQSIFLLLLVFVGTAIAAKTLTRCDDYCGHAPEPFTKRFDTKSPTSWFSLWRPPGSSVF